MVKAEVILPSTPLRPYVHHYWVMKTDNIEMSQIIMPVGCMRWMFHRKKPLFVNGITGLKASVVGLYDKAVKISATEDVEMISVFFMPYVAQIIMGIPCGEFTQDNVDLANLEEPELKELKQRVLEADSTDQCIGMIEDYILAKIIRNQDSPYLKPLSKVFELMADKPDVRVEELASAACLSERQFRRVFIDNVGMKPKQIQRIQRFHLATNEILMSTPDNLDNILYKYGYTDHSHFNREFHEIAGLSPTEYIAFLNKTRKYGIMPWYRSYHAPDD